MFWHREKFLNLAVFAFLIPSLAPAQEACLDSAEFHILFEYSDRAFNSVDHVNLLEPRLVVTEGQALEAISISKAGFAQPIKLTFCVSDQIISNQTAVLHLGPRKYEDVVIVPASSGTPVAWTVIDAEKPDWAYVSEIDLAINKRGVLGIVFSIINTRSLEFGISATASLNWRAYNVCSSPAPFPSREYQIGLYEDDELSLSLVREGRSVPINTEITRFVDAELSGDYCSDAGVKLSIDVNSLELSTDQNSQEFSLLFNLSDDVIELFEDDDLEFSSWNIAFYNENLLISTFGGN